MCIDIDDKETEKKVVNILHGTVNDSIYELFILCTYNEANWMWYVEGKKFYNIKKKIQAKKKRLKDHFCDCDKKKEMWPSLI